MVLAARSADELAEAVDALTDAGHSAEGHRLDVTNLDAQAAFFEAHGPFDILCNSAGMARHSPAAETRIDDYDAVMAVNVKAASTFFVGSGTPGAGKSITPWPSTARIPDSRTADVTSFSRK